MLTRSAVIIADRSAAARAVLHSVAARPHPARSRSQRRAAGCYALGLLLSIAFMRLPQLLFSRIVLSRARSLWFALRIAAAIIGAAILPNPLGSPEFRSVMRVPPDSVSCHE